MANQHHTVDCDTGYQGCEIRIEHNNPHYLPEERESVKKDIEAKLYHIFYKYCN